jgi:imidazolonepropionase-like amidohydrolase
LAVLPGLVEAHFHPTYFNVAALEDLDVKYPVEYVTLLAAANARLALECGYTAALVVQGDLSYTRRRIPLPIGRPKVTDITHRAQRLLDNLNCRSVL